MDAAASGVINGQLLSWCTEHQIQFTRSRLYRKNDNCFVEQKNGKMVRKMIGYTRFDTDFEQKTLAEAYRYLCPLINFWFPTIKLIGEEHFFRLDFLLRHYVGTNTVPPKRRRSGGF
jgi:hypothetical protein